MLWLYALFALSTLKLLQIGAAIQDTQSRSICSTMTLQPDGILLTFMIGTKRFKDMSIKLLKKIKCAFSQLLPLKKINSLVLLPLLTMDGHISRFPLIISAVSALRVLEVLGTIG